MKKTIKSLKFSIAFLFTVLFFIACDKDFNTIESDVLGKNNTNFTTKEGVIPITAYNKKLEALQINNLASSLLGVFNDPAYGQTTASIITQITPVSFNPDFGENPVIDNVTLNIPYFSSAISTDNEGNVQYTLDSLYGNPKAEYRLTIYQNNYFLRDFDPNATTSDNTQKYYSNANSGINTTENFAFNGNSLINFDSQKGGIIYQNNKFKPSAAAVITTTGTGDSAAETRSVPAINILLDNTFWKETIIDKEGDAVLSSSDNFKNYFRGIYIKAEAVNGEGSTVLINLASVDANITINYTSGATDARTESSYVLNFSGNRLNTFINNFDKVTLGDGNKVLGDERLYLKGSEGSMAIVDLFPNGLEDFKNEFRQTDSNGDFVKDELTGNFIAKKLINEAHLIVYEDEIDVPADEADYHKYDRIYAYDINNNITTIDYINDLTANADNPLNSKVISLSQRDPDEGSYKIRITDHLNNILLRDSTNTKLGLVLSTNVNYTNIAPILNSNSNEVSAVPAASILSPRGTILHGSRSNKDEKRLKLKIFFTEPN
ncbi:hypothetical protein A8C32_11725 [Flavivirga aquatica]|uniref:DUF4270 domain-containing protein n=1 Tax=Flavivirga aquatica TaxID=1849968 RepID=A0A1E5TDC8_9FLAO|nr:DUF4270 domain-containing protein [Flavivirga aquatica]OEK09382.1 hypothetical protein A8C32_11725 [Flavivirga aquatica]